MNYESDFAPEMKRLIALFPQRPIAPDTIAAYWSILHEMESDLFRAAVDRCIHTCEWFPTIKHIREAYEDIVMESIPDPYEAMKRFPHRVKNPAMRALVSTRPEEYSADPRSLQPENERSNWIIGEPRRLNDGKPDA